MKKNKMMRLASGLLVACLLTSSIVSGTFAKYVTEKTGSDSARVAKWGITMSDNGYDSFVASYDSSVESFGGDVVAPGTNRSAIYSVDGTPETDYKVTFNYGNLKDIYLGAGVYSYPGYSDSMSRTITDPTKYYPVQYTVTVATTNGDSTGAISNENVAYSYTSLTAALEALKGTTVTFDAKDECDIDVTISWEWPFSTSDVHDAYDTILGDLAARDYFGNPVALVTESTNYSLVISYDLIITATQID